MFTAMAEVILRDFDGTETVVARNPPLPEVIHTEETEPEMAQITTRHYVRTAEVDHEGRPVYTQSNL